MSDDAYIEHVVTLVGERIRIMRDATEMSQYRFSTMAGLDRKNYSSIESGNGNATLKTLCRIARALDIEIEELFIGLDVEMRDSD